MESGDAHKNGRYLTDALSFVATVVDNGVMHVYAEHGVAICLPSLEEFIYIGSGNHAQFYIFDVMSSWHHKMEEDNEL